MVHRRSGAARRSLQMARLNEQRSCTIESVGGIPFFPGMPAPPLNVSALVKPTIAGTTHRPGRGKNHGLMPETQEVIAAVASLHFDQLKPFGRIIRKRVAERVQASGLAPKGCTIGTDSLPDVDVNHIRSVCEQSTQLHVELEDGGDWSVTLVGCKPDFVNVYSPADVYPEELWTGTRAYFESLEYDDMFLPGGRYSCGQAIMASNLPFLKGYSLGQVCHIVQLAISQKKILGYLNGEIVPYGRSLSMMKDQCAGCQAPCNANPVPPEDSSIAFATWDIARSCLQALLSEAAAQQLNGGGIGKIPLSNVKRLFRSQFQIELSETKLGHSKVSELIQDARFADLCSVQLESNGYFVVQKIEPGEECTCPLKTSSDNAPLASTGVFASFDAALNPYLASSSCSPIGARGDSNHLQNLGVGAPGLLNHVFDGYSASPEMQLLAAMACMNRPTWDSTNNPVSLESISSASEQNWPALSPMSVVSSLDAEFGSPVHKRNVRMNSDAHPASLAVAGPRSRSKSMRKDVESSEPQGDSSGSTSARSSSGTSDQELDPSAPWKVPIHAGRYFPSPADPFCLGASFSADARPGVAQAIQPPGLLGPCSSRLSASHATYGHAGRSLQSAYPKHNTDAGSALMQPVRLSQFSNHSTSFYPTANFC